jgi:hypothetical protein
MKGAYITMIGRDKDKLLKVAQSVDVRSKGIANPVLRRRYYDESI